MKIILPLMLIFSAVINYPQSIDFKLKRILLSNCGPYMFNDGSQDIYAYKNSDWGDDSYSEILAEDTPLLDDTSGVTIHSTGFRITSFKKINTVNPNGNPGTAGQMGDLRSYNGGVMEFSHNNNLKLRLKNCRITTLIPYPGPLGTGAAITGSAWGTIDMSAGDPAWRTGFNPNNQQQVRIDFFSMTEVVQGLCAAGGKYDITLRLLTTSNQENIVIKNLRNPGAPVSNGNNSTAGTVLDFSDSTYVTMDFSSFTYGGPDGDELGEVTVNYITKSPGGTLPATINSLSNYYWEMGTNLASYNTSISFDLSGLGGITDINDIRILKRERDGADWVIYTDYDLIGNTLRANGVTSFSDWALGTIGNDPLPVELTSFTAVHKENRVELKWQTAIEVNNYGFHVERKVHSAESIGWEEIGFVNGYGNSSSIKEYSFTDNLNLEHEQELELIKYRLKQIDTGGGFEYSKEIEVDINIIPIQFSLAQNYPNPFNPSTSIEYNVASIEHVTLKIYDVLGKEIAMLVNETKPPGEYEIEFDGSSLTSGVYYYRLTAGSFSDTKKLVLMK